MPGSIDISQSDVQSYSADIEGTSSTIQAKTLSSIDNESTITGNKECQEAFEKSQQMLTKLMEVAKREAGMIDQLGEEFTEADNCLAQMISGGYYES